MSVKTVETAHVVEDTQSVHVGPGPKWTNGTATTPNSVKTITFNDGNKVVGKISWSTGEFKFTGDTNTSADIFFNQVLKTLCDQYVEKSKVIDLELKTLLLHCTQLLGDKYPETSQQIKNYFT